MKTSIAKHGSFDRREFLAQSAALGAAALAGAHLLATPAWSWQERPKLEIATFRADVSPPEGHPLCGGWIQAVVGQDDALEANGLVILGAGEPIVLCAVDWTGLLNEAHIAWRTALAEAAGTTPERVAVQCVHQHNAPFVCLEARRECQKHSDLQNAVVGDEFFESSLAGAADALRKSLANPRPITHIAAGQAEVEKVASNRRLADAEGKIIAWRGSASKDPLHKELPEGLIDKQLKTVAFYDGGERVAACHYYATHPMSYYGDGRLSSDFVGLARKRLQEEERGCAHLYFTGCSGNVAAGKYNEGTPQSRRELTDRMHDAMKRSLALLAPREIGRVVWRTEEVMPAVRASFAEEQLLATIANRDASLADRIRASMMLSWVRRSARKIPIVLSGLHIDDISLLHLPAESFVEYQLRAQQTAPGRFVATAAYGDGGPWYIPVKEAYPQGFYEVSVAFCEPTVDDVLSAGISRLLDI